MAPQQRRRWSRAGQALVETAIAGPVLLIMTAGGLQFALFGYGNASIDTAAREGARVAVEQPNSNLSWAVGGRTERDCSIPLSGDSNSICQAVANNLGLLSSNSVSRVSVTVTSAATFAQRRGDAQLLALSCSNVHDAQVTGSVTAPIPSGTLKVSDTLGGVTSADAAGNFSVCLPSTYFSTVNPRTDEVTVSVACSGGGTQNGSASTSITQDTGNNGNGGGDVTYTYSNKPMSITLSSCPTATTPTTTSTTTTSSTSSSTTSTGTTSSSSTTTTTVSTTPTVGGTPPPTSCTNSPVAAGDYVTVHVEYQARIFVPLLGAVMGDSASAGYRTLQSTVTMRVQPCASI